MDTQELLTHLIGPGSIALLIGALIYAYIGAFIMLLLTTTKRDPLSDRTPFCFSWRFLWSDNTKRLIATIILIFIAIRFSRELIGADITMWAAVLIGLGCDKLAEIIKSKTNLFDKQKDKP